MGALRCAVHPAVVAVAEWRRKGDWGMCMDCTRRVPGAARRLIRLEEVMPFMEEETALLTLDCGDGIAVTPEEGRRLLSLNAVMDAWCGACKATRKIVAVLEVDDE